MNDVRKWLEANGLGQYAETFATNDIDFDLIATLTDDDLKELGLTLGHRKRFAQTVARLDEIGPDGPIVNANAPGDRRPVTVLFADISRFTKLSGELGAEATRDLLNKFFAVADRAIADYGGRIDKHIGDEVMAVFGAPQAHDNDPERAVRAALAIHDGIANFEPPLQVHVGIASGTVVASGTGSDTHREYTVIGDSVNLASRLCDLAGPGEIIISSEVHRAITNVAESTPLDAARLKGIDAPVQVWRITALCDAVAPRGPLFGRRLELQQFDGALDEMRRGKRGQLFILRGEAGIGKTRLIEEFAVRATAARIAVHRTAILDFGTGTGEEAVRDLIASLLELPAGKTQAEAVETLFESSKLAQPLAPYLTELLGLPQPAKTRAIYAAEEPAARSRGLAAAISTAVETAAADRPLLLIVEDAHWAAAVVRDRLAALAAAMTALPVLLVLTTRSENDPFDAGWRSAARGAPIVTCDLGPLASEDAMALTEAIADLDEKLQADCIERSEGNPLFLEHLVRASRETHTSGLPDSVQSIVLAQVDRLPVSERELLQAAAVFGQRFNEAGVASVLNRRMVAVEPLAARGLVRRDGDAWRFSHALVREGVYASLLTSHTRKFHRSAADWYRTLDPTLHAEHLALAGDASAPAAFLAAAREQAAAYRYSIALDLATRGAELAEDADFRFTLDLLVADINRDSGEVNAALDQYRALSATAPDMVARRHAALGEVACLRVMGQVVDGLARLAAIELEAAEDIDRARFHHYRGALRFSDADMIGCLADQEAALEYARAAGDPEWEALALGGIGDALYAAGRMGKAYESFLACVDLAARHGYGRIELANRHMVGVCRRYMNELAAGYEDVETAWKFAERVGNIRSLIITGIIVAEMLMELGDAAEARALLETNASRITEIGNERLEAYNTINLARAHLLLGEITEARTLTENALALSRTVGMVFVGARVLGMQGLVASSEAERREALAKGESLIAEQQPIAHNVLWFYRDAIEAALDQGDWDAADRYAGAYAAYTAAEPLPWCDFFIARGRSLAALGRDPSDEAARQAAADTLAVAREVGFVHASDRLTRAIN